VQKDNPDYQIFLQKKISRSHISFLQYRW
jgi:hypothetical protein